MHRLQADGPAGDPEAAIETRTEAAAAATIPSQSTQASFATADHVLTLVPSAVGASQAPTARCNSGYFSVGQQQTDWRFNTAGVLPDAVCAAHDLAIAQTTGGDDAIRSELWALSALDWLEPLVQSGGKRKSPLAPGQQKTAAVDVVLSAQPW